MDMENTFRQYGDGGLRDNEEPKATKPIAQQPIILPPPTAVTRKGLPVQVSQKGQQGKNSHRTKGSVPPPIWLPGATRAIRPTGNAAQGDSNSTRTNMRSPAKTGACTTAPVLLQAQANPTRPRRVDLAWTEAHDDLFDHRQEDPRRLTPRQTYPMCAAVTTQPPYSAASQVPSASASTARNPSMRIPTVDNSGQQQMNSHEPMSFRGMGAYNTPGLFERANSLGELPPSLHSLGEGSVRNTALFYGGQPHGLTPHHLNTFTPSGYGAAPNSYFGGGATPLARSPAMFNYTRGVGSFVDHAPMLPSYPLANDEDNSRGGVSMTGGLHGIAQANHQAGLNAIETPGANLMEQVSITWRNIPDYGKIEIDDNAYVEVFMGRQLDFAWVGKVMDYSTKKMDSGTFQVDFGHGRVAIYDVPVGRIRQADYPLPRTSFEEIPIVSQSGTSPNSFYKGSNVNDSPTSEDTTETSANPTPSPGTADEDGFEESLSPSITAPSFQSAWSGRERPMMPNTSDLHPSSKVDVFLPAITEGDPAARRPPMWCRGVVEQCVYADPREARKSNFPVMRANTRAGGDYWCAVSWGGFCQCAYLNKECLGAEGGSARMALLYLVNYRTETGEQRGVAPWYCVRPRSIESALDEADLKYHRRRIPDPLVKVPVSSHVYKNDPIFRLTKTKNDAGQFRGEDEPVPWVDSDYAAMQLKLIRFHSRALHHSINFSYDSNGERQCEIAFLGHDHASLTAVNYLSSALTATQNTLDFYERREKRLRLLFERRSKYTIDALEFLADDSLVGFMIGKQGEQLAAIARANKVEIRVLPDDDGYRRVRIYGGQSQNSLRAKSEIDFRLDFIELHKKLHDSLANNNRLHIWKELKDTFKLVSIYVETSDKALDDSRSHNYFKDACVVQAVANARAHATKKRAALVGTKEKPVLIVCGTMNNTNAVRDIIKRSNKEGEIVSYAAKDAYPKTISNKSNASISVVSPPASKNGPTVSQRSGGRGQGGNPRKR